MSKTPLILHIFSLTESEISSFQLWLESPFFNQRKELEQLFHWIIKFRNSDNHKAMTKQAAFSAIFKHQEYDDQKLRHIMSYLLQQLRQFLIWQTLQAKPIQQQTYLLENLGQRGLEKAYEKQWRKTERAIEQQAFRNQDYHFQLYQIQLENYTFQKRYSREKKMPLQEISTTFTVYSISNLLKWHCNILTHKSVTQENYDSVYLDNVLAFLNGGYYNDIPAVQVYYQAYQALITRNETYYQALKTIILDVFEQFPIHEIRDLVLLAINFCIKKLNSGEGEFLREVFQWYKTGLDNSIFIINGELSRFTYNNVVLAGLKLEDFNWTKSFIETYKPYINPKQQHDTYYFNLALWHQFQQQYEAVQTLLLKVTFQDVLHALHAKRILLKIYFETDSIKALESLLESIKIYLYRHKKLGYHKDNYLKLIRYTQKLIRLNRYDAAERYKLRQEIQAEKSLLEKTWFLNQLGER